MKLATISSLTFLILPYQLTSCSWVLLDKSTVAQLLTMFPTFYEIRTFIAASTRAPYWSLSMAVFLPFNTKIRN
jgi:hypothetical protein